MASRLAPPSAFSIATGRIAHEVLRLGSRDALPVNLRDPAGRHAEVIERQARQVPQHAREIALLAIPNSAGDRPRAKDHHPPSTEPPHEIDILHEWHRLIAANQGIKT